MAEHNELGKAGENAAVAYLEEHGYLIRHRNWRKGHFELDIVAAKENELVIVEVKHAVTLCLPNRKKPSIYQRLNGQYVLPTHI